MQLNQCTGLWELKFTSPLSLTDFLKNSISHNAIHLSLKWTVWCFMGVACLLLHHQKCRLCRELAKRGGWVHHKPQLQLDEAMCHNRKMKFNIELTQNRVLRFVQQNQNENEMIEEMEIYVVLTNIVEMKHWHFKVKYYIIFFLWKCLNFNTLSCFRKIIVEMPQGKEGRKILNVIKL